MNDDMSQFLGVFLDEAGEQMELLERDILTLESETSQELLQEIFRAAHTLKGSSRAMGFVPMGELTHAMEDVFDKLRHEELSVSSELINALFNGLDALKAMKDEIAATGTTTLDTTEQTARLRAVLDGTPAAKSAPAPAAAAEPAAAPAAETAPPVVSAAVSATSAVAPAAFTFKTRLSAAEQMAYQDASAADNAIYGMTIRISSDCVMKSVRALMVLQALEKVGSILATTPGEEALENEEFESEFEVVLATQKSVAAVQATATGITEIAEVVIAPWGEEAAPVISAAAVAAPAASVTFKTRLSAAEQMAYQDARAADNAIYGMTIRISSDCVMKSVRALMVLQALEKVGSILATTPGEEALENEEFESEFEVVLATQKSVAAVQATATGITEIAEVVIAPWGEEAPAVTVAASSASSPAPAKAAATETPKAAAEPTAANERKVDAGPEARGKSPDEVQKIAAEKKAAPAQTQQSQTVRVDVARLDKLLNLVGELVIDRTRIAQLGGQFERQFHANGSGLVESLNETAAHIARITDELQEEIMKARMLPIDNVFNRFPRMIRDLAQKLGKEIDFIVEGKETELDRSVIEVIGDPLIHMLRNSVDHGIEMPDVREQAGKPRTGKVRLSAKHQENHIVIEIEDDGKGMAPDALRAHAVKKGVLTQEAANRLTDQEAINLIFAAGFSTAQVVSDVSGRGVGMDIVKSNLQKLGATVDITSKAGFGSKFTVKLPLTLAIIRGLLVKVRGCVYALPLGSVVETLKITNDQVHVVNHREVMLQRGHTLPIVRLREVFHLDDGVTPAERTLEGDNLPAETIMDMSQAVTTATKRASRPGSRASRRAAEALYLVVVGMGEDQVGLVVDSLIGEQEVVIKGLGKFIGDIKGISGATILGDGRVALIVDINGIIGIAMEEKGAVYAA